MVNEGINFIIIRSYILTLLYCLAGILEGNSSLKDPPPLMQAKLLYKSCIDVGNIQIIWLKQ